MISNYFRKLYHTEGEYQISFVHRSIYEYFVVCAVFEVIEKYSKDLGDKAFQKKFMGEIPGILRKRQFSEHMRGYLAVKLKRLIGTFSQQKKDTYETWWETIPHEMIINGMFYYCDSVSKGTRSYIDGESACFCNLVYIRQILTCIYKNKIFNLCKSHNMDIYIKYWGIDNEENINKVDLRGANLRGVDLRRADMREANLSGAKLPKDYGKQ